VCAAQASFYVVRERRHLWSSRPSSWVIASSVLDIGIITTLAYFGILVHRLPGTLIGAVIVAAFAFTFLLDLVKNVVFRVLQVA
ncbi:MAG: divalent cation transporter, partial [Steroidobacteraceae bacterium]|nr:divalent cation transporter [Steroidobacteraceae bacterium]